MGEFHEDLDREARRVSGDPEVLDEVMVRAGRRRIRRQIVTGVVALAIAGGSFALALAAFRGPGTARPAVGPTPSASSPVRVRLIDGAEDPAAARRAVDTIEENRRYSVVRIGEADHPFIYTRINCPREFDDEAVEIMNQLSLERTNISAAIPNPAYDLTVYLGEDWETGVRVLNGTTTPALASDLSAVLHKAGWAVRAPANADDLHQHTVVFARPWARQDAQELAASLLPSVNPRFRSSNEGPDIVVILGRDYARTHRDAAN